MSGQLMTEPKHKLAKTLIVALVAVLTIVGTLAFFSWKNQQEEINKYNAILSFFTERYKAGMLNKKISEEDLNKIASQLSDISDERRDTLAEELYSECKLVMTTEEVWQTWHFIGEYTSFFVDGKIIGVTRLHGSPSVRDPGRTKNLRIFTQP